ncbi:unnamed protein product [Ceratitis capitata]|uniref:(Mediterranean fruit fly) hypothetical protein n=1 Tax=Ceratitis capitata TaxID=7213 RepID=A0A811VAN6_CERCA|nr:unnamed protein product [Ceratitis capitata]
MGDGLLLFYETLFLLQMFEKNFLFNLAGRKKGAPAKATAKQSLLLALPKTNNNNNNMIMLYSCKTLHFAYILPFSLKLCNKRHRPLSRSNTNTYRHTDIHMYIRKCK